jgi:acetyltransferase-like isoleucine patch superfamily enzyme
MTNRIRASAARHWRNMHRHGFARQGDDVKVSRPFLVERPDCFHLGDRVFLGAHCSFVAVVERNGGKFSPRIAIGDDVYIGHHSQIHCQNAITLGVGVVLSDYVLLSDTAHGFDPHAGLIMRQPVVSKGPVVIGDNCFLGHGSCVMGNVTIGPWCIVGARTVVTKSFPPYCMVAGSPARIVRRWSEADKRWNTVRPGEEPNIGDVAS